LHLCIEFSDDDKRATYDAWGEKSVDDDNASQFDPFTFFAVLFDSWLKHMASWLCHLILNQLMKLNRRVYRAPLQTTCY
jgi:hypothetical protein